MSLNQSPELHDGNPSTIHGAVEATERHGRQNAQFASGPPVDASSAAVPRASPAKQAKVLLNSSEGAAADLEKSRHHQQPEELHHQQQPLQPLQLLQLLTQQAPRDLTPQQEQGQQPQQQQEPQHPPGQGEDHQQQQQQQQQQHGSHREFALLERFLGKQKELEVGCWRTMFWSRGQ
jgi:hypothetical protein